MIASSVDSLAVVILTHNEEKNLPELLRSIEPLRARVFVVDSGSFDNTIEIAQSSDAATLTHPFTTHAAQWNWSLQQLPPDVRWVLGLDADQRLTPEACVSIRELVDSGEADVEGAYLARRQVFRGRWIRFGGYYPKYLLKLFRVDAVSSDVNDLVDHHFSVKGKTRILRGDLIEANANELRIQVWIEKHNRYAALQAQDEIRRADASERSGRPFGDPDQRTLWLKAWWRRTPLYIRPFFYFVYRYFFRFGFLDGKQGFIFHFMQAFWYRLLVDINIDEIRSQPTRE